MCASDCGLVVAFSHGYRTLVQKAEALAQSVAEKTTNYYGLDIALKSIETESSDLFSRIQASAAQFLPAEGFPRDCVERIQGTVLQISQDFSHCQQRVAQIVEAAKKYLLSFYRPFELQQRWIKLGLPEEVIRVCPECIVPLMDSSVAYAMVALKNEETFGIDTKNAVGSILVKGAMVPWAVFSSEYHYDNRTKHFVKNDTPSIHLTFTAPPVGFIEADQYTYRKLFSIKELTDDEFCALKSHAAKFGAAPSSVDGVLQIFTSPGAFRLPKLLRPLVQEVVDQNAYELPSHYGVRLIADKKVYSMGMGFGEFEEELSPWQAAATVHGRIKMIDQDEFWQYPHGRVVTSIPLSKEHIETIVATVEHTQQEGGRPMNFGYSNCATLVKELLQKVGISVDISVPFSRVYSIAFRAAFCAFRKWVPDSPTCLRSCVKPLTSVLAALGEKIQQLWQFVCAVGAFCMRFYPLQKLLSFSFVIITFPARLLTPLVSDLLLWAIGGTAMSRKAEELATGDVRYHPLLQVSSWWRLFLPSTTNIDSSAPLLAWQLQQATTQIHTYTGKPALTLLKT